MSILPKNTKGLIHKLFFRKIISRKSQSWNPVVPVRPVSIRQPRKASPLEAPLEAKFNFSVIARPFLWMWQSLFSQDPTLHKFHAHKMRFYDKNIIFIKFIKIIKIIHIFLSHKTTLKIKIPHFQWLNNRWLKLKITFGEKKSIQLPNWLFGFAIIIMISSGSYLWFTKPKLNYNPYFSSAPSDTGYKYQNKNNNVNILIGRSDQPNVPAARFEVAPGKMIEFVAENLTAQKVAFQGSRQVLYQDVKKDTDISYEIAEKGLMEKIIFKKPLPVIASPSTDSEHGNLSNTNNQNEITSSSSPRNDISTSPSEISYIISIPSDLEIKETVPNQLTFYQKNGGYLFNFDKPSLIDANNIKSDNVKIKVRRVNPVTEASVILSEAKNPIRNTENKGQSPQDDKMNQYRVTFTPDSDWLADKNRRYPVVLDPTIIYDTSAVFATGTMNRIGDTGSGFFPQLNIPYREQTADINTVALWHFNETTGAGVSDSSGNGNSGVATGTTIVSGKFGNARSFNGTSDYITCSKSPTQGTGSFSIFAWINTTSFNARKEIISYGAATANNGIYLYVNPNGTVETDLSNNYGPISTSTVADGKWHHVGVVNSNGTFQIYIDGIPSGSASSMSPNISSTSNCLIGNNFSVGTYYFNGIIDDLRITNVALSPEEIKTNAFTFPYGVYTSPVIDFGTAPQSLNSLAWVDNITPPDILTGWSKSKPILIDNTINTSALTNFCVRTHINYESTMQTDFSDIRFTNISGSSLGYWIDSKTNGVEANAWLQVDTIPANSTGVFYMLYGNSSGVASGTSPSYGPPIAFEDSFDGGTQPSWNTSSATYVDLPNSTKTVNLPAGIAVVNWAFSYYKPTTIGGDTVRVVIGSNNGPDTNISTNETSSHKGVSGSWSTSVSASSVVIKLQVKYRSGGNFTLNQDYVSWHVIVVPSGSSNTFLDSLVSGSQAAWGTGSTAYVDLPNSSKSVTLPAGKAIINWTYSSYGSAGPNSMTAVIGSQSSPEFDMYTNEASSHKVYSGSWSTTVSAGSVTTKLQIRSRTVGVGISVNNDDHLSWNIVVIPSNSTNTSVVDSLVAGSQSSWNTSSGTYVDIPNTSKTETLPAGDVVVKWNLSRYKSSTGGGDFVRVLLTNTNYTTFAGPNQYIYSNENGSHKTYSGSAKITVPAGIYTVDLQTYVNTGGAFTLDNNDYTSWAIMTVANNPNSYAGEDIEFQTRTSADNSTWEAWKTNTNETALANMDADQTNWSWVSQSTSAPISKADESTIKMEGTGSMKVTVGQPQKDNNTIGLWHLDETAVGTGTTVYDSSSNGHNGISTGTSLANGFFNKARTFASASDYINVGNLGTLTIPETISAWVYITSCSGINIITQTKDDTSAYRGTQLGTDITTCAPFVEYMDGGGKTSSNYRKKIATSTVPLNQWVHIGAIMRGATDMSLYINGVDAGGAYSGTGGSISGDSSSGYIGLDPVYSSYMRGSIDELKIENGARTANEIAESYRAGRDYHLEKTISSTDLSSATKIPFYIASDRTGTNLEAYIGESAGSVNEPDANTIGWWHMEETGGSGAYILDSSGNNNNATPTSGTTSTQGKIGRGRYFNGTSDYMTAANESQFEGLNNITVEAWIKTPTTNPTTNAVVIGKDDASFQRSWGMWALTTGAYYFFVAGTNSSSSDITTNAAMNDGKWHHFAATWSTGSAPNIYIDGALAVGTSTNSATGAILNTTSPVTFGASASPNSYYSGTLDEIQISNIARSATEIQQNYQYGLRTHQITTDFVVNPDVSFNTNYAFQIDNPPDTTDIHKYLNVGDVIIVKENVGGSEYVNQGTVTSIGIASSSVSTINVSPSFSNMPPTGYTTKAVVFKWQREYWDLNDISPSDRNTITKLGVRILDASQGFTFYLDDFRSNSNYLYQPFGNTISSTPNRYFQYRTIMTNNNGASPILSRASVNYTLTPSEKDNRPIAQWKMDEGQGTIAYDETINNNDATLNGMSASAWVDGVIGKGLSFAGSPQYLSIPNSADINFGTHSMSFSAFINTGNSGSVIDKFSVNKGYKITVSTTGKATFSIGNGTSTPSVIGNKTINDSSWHNIVAVRDTATTSLKLYVDGILDNTAPDYSGPINIDSTVDVMIGRDSAGSYYYNGKMDEVELYDYALSAQQVKTVNNKNAGAVLGATRNINKGGNSPVGYWNFNEGTGTTGFDTSGKGNNGVLSVYTSGSAPNWTVNGKIGSALNYDGVGGYFDVPYSTSLDTPLFTVESWIQIGTTAGTQGIISKGPTNVVNGVGYNYNLYQTAGTVSGSIYVGPSNVVVNSTSLISANQWYHTALVYDGTNLNIYLNGILVGTTAFTGVANTAGGYDLYIGARQNTTPLFHPTNFFTGVIDQAKIYGYARSASQIQTDMASGPISYWKFDEGSGLIAYDEMKNVNLNFGAGNSIPSWTNDGRFGNGLVFDNRDYMQTQTNTFKLQNFSVDLWVKTTDQDAYLVSYENSNAYYGWNIYTVTGGYVTFQLNTSLGGFLAGVSSPSSITDNQWHHITTTNDGSTLKLYLDGRLSNSAASATAVWDTSMYLDVSGYRPAIAAGGGYLTGTLDEIKFYNYVLTADEIKVDYNQSSSLRLGNPININNGGSGPVGYWKFDEGTGSTAYDASGTGNNGSLPAGSAPTWVDNGKVGSALSFDGTNRYVDLGNSTSWKFGTGDFTVSFWMKPAVWSGLIVPISESVWVGATWDGFHFEHDDGSKCTANKMAFYVGSQALCTTTTPAVNNWYYVTGIRQSGTASVYINGIRENSASRTANVTVNRSLLVGRNQDTSFPRYFQGLVDQVKIYNYARSQKQIMEDMNGGKPVAWWKLDEKTGSTAFDDSDYQNNGPYDSGTNAPSPILGKNGWALQFTGSNSQEVTIPDSKSLNISGNQLTISDWININSGTTSVGILSKASSNGYYSWIGTDGKISLSFYIGGVLKSQTSSIALNDGRWHHFEGVYDGSNIKIYLDGHLDSTSGAITGNIDASSGVNFYLGSYNSAFYSGLLDDVKIYNYARSADEVKLDYTGGAVVFK